jgi:tRNA nucleotidyltransferase (CCA-adding enzyme)
MLTAVGALEAVRASPCGRRLLDALADVPGAVLVGGAVRDALLGRPLGPDLDVAVPDEDALQRLAARLGGQLERHDRFGTATAGEGGCRFDLVTMRAEDYAAPGALPEVRPGDLHDDLSRRDFTVNTLALGAGGVLHGVDGALEDLAARRLRVLHDRSFLDDPTRLWRLVRYAVRLAFLPDAHTDALARAAVAGGALETVSAQRLAAELRRALAEPDPLAVLHAAGHLGLVGGLRPDPALTAAAGALLPAGEGDPALLVLGSTLPGGQLHPRTARLLEALTAEEQRVLGRCAAAAPLPAGLPASELDRRLRGEPVEAVALAGARGDVAGALRWLGELRHVVLEIDGRDLLAAGIRAGPDLGRRLRATLDAKLDGQVAGRDAELRFALQPPRGA